jgi:antitoxin MazE
MMEVDPTWTYDILCINMGAIMKTQVGKWGNSLAVRIPGTYAKELDLDEGVELEITRVNGGLLLRKRKHEYTLAELLAQITPENIHGETDWGPAVGREAW